jgi:acid phosphatase family membrane protein YuiD
MDNSILLIPIAAGLIAQILKFFIKSNRQKADLKGLMAYSGMPSGHSALVVSLVTIIGLREGVNTPLFAVAFIMATIVIRDALGIRRYLGEHGRILNILVRDLKNDDVLEQKYPHLLEKIGHTPVQVAVGGLIGFIVSLVGFFLL